MTRTRLSGAASLVGAVMAATPVAAWAADGAPEHQPSPAAGVEIWASTDSDNTDVLKVLGRALWTFDGPASYAGIAVERAWFRPQGQFTRKQDRFYLDLANGSTKWKWRVRAGTNGHTVLGSASVRAADWSKEFFLEREIVETPRGVDEGIYYTFAGASIDLISRDRDSLNGVVGLQEFTGRNERIHLRSTYVHVIDPKHGLSVQLRGRYFHSTHPGEFDYYSPKDFWQVIPVIQMRRFTHGGWMVLGAAGIGAQGSTGSHAQSARLADLRLESPASSRKVQAFAQVQYSNSSLVGAAGGYHYVMGRLGITARF